MKIAIIGGGAAGLMAAATLLEEHIDAVIHIFEKNQVLGKKVSISGGGRCNVTTGITDKQLLLSKYIRGSKFLIPAFGLFPPQKVIEWFEKNRLPLKIEKDNRVFPVSDIGSDVVDLFTRIFNNKILIHYSEPVKLLLPIGKTGFKVETEKGIFDFDIVIITSGGNAYSHTGSSGDGYNFAKSCGHTITRLGPSLNSFEVEENWCKKLSGISIKNARLETILENNIKKSTIGPFIFTHFGISGPVTFAISAHLAFSMISKSSPIKILFSPDADETFESWNKKFQDIISVSGGRQIKNILSEFLPERFAEEILILSQIRRDKKAAEVSKEERKIICKLLSGNIEITLIARKKGDEFVTAGGVCLNEVDRKTMQSIINPNLYLAGEVLDIDGLTGGFNLQSAWATGRLAGVNIAKRLNS